MLSENCKQQKMLLTVEGWGFFFCFVSFLNTLNRAVQGKQDAILLALKSQSGM